MKSISQTPEKWAVIKLLYKDENLYKVFGSWSGGYLDSDHWKLNSGIKSIEEDGDFYFIEGWSGSWYKCHKSGYGVTGAYNMGVLDNIVNKSIDNGIDIKVLTEEEFNQEKRDNKLNKILS